MAHLSDEIKTQIVTRLAQFEGCSAVAQEVGSANDIELTRFQVRTYDASSAGFAAGERWRTLFFKVRRAFVEDVGSVPISHAGYRLNELQRLFDATRAAGNIGAALKLLQQAAIESGMHEARRAQIPSDDDGLTADERRTRLRELVRKALDR